MKKNEKWKAKSLASPRGADFKGRRKENVKSFGRWKAFLGRTREGQ